MPYTTLVSPEALYEHLDDPSWVIIDCRHTLADFSLGRRVYGESHIRGAYFADMEHDLAGPKSGKNGRHPLPDPQTFAAFLRGLGVNDDTQIVAYDAGADMASSRLWFLCKWIGHEAVAVLDGGFAAWQEAGYPTSAAIPPQRHGTLQARLDLSLVVDSAYVYQHIDDTQMRILDARAADRFAGQNETVDPVAGHIPGATNRWFKENFDERGRWKSPHALKAAFEQIAPAKQIVHQCGSGVSAAVNLLAMELAGLPGSRLYAGSWSEWIADPERPIVTGP